jgi:hypothetical protein
MELYSRYVTIARMSWMSGGIQMELNCFSIPSQQQKGLTRTNMMRDLTTAAGGERNSSLNYDVHALCILCESTSTNPEGEMSGKYLVQSNLNIQNKGHKPIFEICNRRVIDLTLGTNGVGNLLVH